MATTQQPQSRTVQPAPAAPGATAVPAEPKKSFLDMILDAAPRIEPLIPKGGTINQVAAATHLSLKKEPALRKCTPESIIEAVARIQQWGLEIGVTAHLVPFGATCTPVADYKGLAHLMRVTGAVRHVETRVVRAGDVFEYAFGLDAKLVHVPSAKSEGAITHAYCVLRLPFGQSSFEVMTVGEVDAIRRKYSKQWKEGPCPAWYAKKTVLRQAAKLVPTNPKLADAMRVMQDDAAAEGLPPVLDAIVRGHEADDDVPRSGAPETDEGDVSDTEAEAYWNAQDPQDARAGR